MGSFLLNVLASLVAAVLLILLAAVLSRRARDLLTALASVFLHIDVKSVFADSKEADPLIREALNRAKEIRILTGRGRQFQGDLYDAALVGVSGRKPSVKVLLPETAVKAQGTDWVEQRERELAAHDKSFGNGLLRQQIAAVAAGLAKFVEAGRFEVRKFDLPHIGRILLTDEYLFLTPYSEAHGRHSRVYQYGRGDTYEMFSRFFNMAWKDSEDRIVSPIAPDEG